MDLYNFNSVEIIPDLKAAVAFTVNSSEVFKESEDITPVIIDKDLSYMPWGADNNLPYRVLDLIESDETLSTCQLFNATFDPYSGDFIPEQNHKQLLAEGSILVAIDSLGNRVGALHQTVERNVAWISHVAVMSAARGHHVGKALLDDFVERNHTSDKSHYMLWVQQQNTAAVAMYQKKGFTSLGKSTLSLIKQQ